MDSLSSKDLLGFLAFSLVFLVVFFGINYYSFNKNSHNPVINKKSRIKALFWTVIEYFV